MALHRPVMYFHHRDAKCFKCGVALRDHSPTRFNPGDGHYRGHCSKCNLFTWYNCAESTVEMIEARESRTREGK